MNIFLCNIFLLRSAHAAILPAIQMDGLKAIYESMDGENWESSTGWIFDDVIDIDPCFWYGITCQSEDTDDPEQDTSTAITSIIELNLQNNCLKGSIPAEIMNLDTLSVLSIDGNKVEGEIPGSFKQLSSLKRLSLSNCNIHSNMDSFVSKLSSSLVDIILNDNFFSGTIPTTIARFKHVSTLFLNSNLLQVDIGNFFMNAPRRLAYLSMGSNPYISGSLPSALGDFKSLQQLKISYSQLTGVIPTELSKLSSLKVLALHYNSIRGTIPGYFGKLVDLSYINFHKNQLTGTIPAELANVVNLNWLELAENKLTGQIPPELGNPGNLSYINVRTNLLTGTVPPELGDLDTLQYLHIFANKLVGRIPSTIGRLTKLKSLALFQNKMTGSLPTSISRMSRLKFIRLNDNRFTGKIPSALKVLSNVELLVLANNSFTGPLPDISSMTNLQFFDCSNNSLVGTLPASYGNFTRIVYMNMNRNSFTGTIPAAWSQADPVTLRLDHNQLSGSLPSSFSQLRYIEILLVSANKLIGDPALAFNASAQKRLTNIDLGSNQFYGNLPAEIFRLPKLKSFSATQNCFYGEIPASICGAKNLETLAIAGLRASPQCSLELDFLYVKPAIAPAMTGSIPACVWSLPRIKDMQLSGNGLDGELFAPPRYSNLSSVRMSGNKVRGNADDAFQKFPFKTLDLADNKIRGEWKYLPNNFNASSSLLFLSVNRLSGDLPGGLQKAKKIRVLAGNVWSCKNLPEFDPARESYVCGSSGYDNVLNVFSYLISFWAFCCVVFVLVVLSVAVRYRKKYNEGWFEGGNLVVVGVMYEYLKAWFTAVGTNVITHHVAAMELFTKFAIPNREVGGRLDLPELQGFVDVLRIYRRTSVVLILILVCVCAPLYPVLKTVNDGEEKLVDINYNWQNSGVFMSGIGSSLLLFFLWNFVIVVYTFLISLANFSLKEIKLKKVETRSRLAEVGRKGAELTATTIIISLDVAAVLILNFMFVFIMLSDYSPTIKSVTQFSKGILDSVVEVIITMMLTAAIEHKKTFTFWRAFILIFNSVGAPILIILLQSDSCFQRVFNPAATVLTESSYDGCYTIGVQEVVDELYCLAYGPITTVSEYQPGFVYNSTCSQALFVSYIPAVMFGYLVSGYVTPWLLVIFPAGTKHSTISKMFGDVDLIVNAVFPAYLWPSDAPIEKEDNPLIPSGDIMAGFVKDFTLMLTFGFISPPLAVCIFGAIFFKTMFLQLLIGRFVATSERHAQKMNDACEQARFSPLYCVTVLQLSTGIFQAVVVLDMMSDKIPLTVAFWPSLVILMSAVIMRLAIPYAVKVCCSRKHLPEDEEEEDEEEISGADDSPAKIDSRKAMFRAARRAAREEEEVWEDHEVTVVGHRGDESKDGLDLSSEEEHATNNESVCTSPNYRCSVS